MRFYVWIPGILGTALRQTEAPRDEIWPPGQVNGFTSRTLAQLTSSLEPTHIIDDVCVVPVYSSVSKLFADAGIPVWQTGQTGPSALLKYSYDWRLGIESNADRLSVILNNAVKEGDEIVVFAHSMGALIGRFILEAVKYIDASFRSRVTRFISVNGVLLGAPIMLARALGIEQTEFISWADQPALLATAPLSGAYSLLPSPWEGRLFNGSQLVDIYNPNNYKSLNFGDNNMKDSASVWGQILHGVRDERIQYVLISSLLDGPSTIEQVKFENGAWARVYGVGDGAVPPWSSQGIPKAVIVDPIPGEHRGVLDTAKFRELFSTWVAPVPLAEETLLIQPLKQHFRAGSVAQFGVIRPSPGTVEEGTLQWTRLADNGSPLGGPVRVEPVAIRSDAAPVVSSRVPDISGNYEVGLRLQSGLASTRIGVRSHDDQMSMAAPSLRQSFGTKPLSLAVGKISDAARIPTLLEIASNVDELQAAQQKAASKLLCYDGEKYPTDGCAITLSVLLQTAGINIDDVFQAFELGKHLKSARGWEVVPLGQQQAGDVGSTCGNMPLHGRDHIYLVLKVSNTDEMIVADNQALQPHFRFASGKGGKTPTTFFLRST